MPTPKYGVEALTIDGEPYDIASEMSYNITTLSSESTLGANGPIGAKIMPRVPFIEGVIYDRADLPLLRLMQTQDATIVLRLRNGKAVYLRGAFVAGEPSVAGGEGAISVRFEGTSAGEA